MNSTIVPFTLQLPTDIPFAFSVQALVTRLATLTDRRKRRGVRYPLPVLLSLVVLGKLAGHSRISALADWARLRAQELAELFSLQNARMPHPSTWSRVLGNAVDSQQLENTLSSFFAELLASPEVPQRGSIVLAVDGKTLRGTIPAHATRGVHLVAAYLPHQGVTLTQLAVDSKENEIVAIPRLLAQLDLRGVVVIGDAMQTQRTLSTQIVEAQGDYVWFVKDNQASLLAELKLLFTPPQLAKGWSAPPLDFTTAQEVSLAHGRLEQRVLTVSHMLHDYSTWPYLEQAFRLERHITQQGKTTMEVCYGITSLPPLVAKAECLLKVTRAEWGIENGLHYRRDVSLHEDASQFRRGSGPQVMAAVNNAVISLVALGGEHNLPAAQRSFDYAFDRFLARLVP